MGVSVLSVGCRRMDGISPLSMDSTNFVAAVLASAAMGSLVTWFGTWFFRDQDERRKSAILGRQAALLAASLEVMFFVVEKQSATEFDAQRLARLMALLNSSEFLGFVKAEELVSVYAALTVIEVEHLQYERIYPRFVDLHARAILGHLVETENKELERIETALRDFAKKAGHILKKDVKPRLGRVVQRLEARYAGPWEDSA